MFFSVGGCLGGLPTPPQPKKVLFLARVSVFFSVEGRLGGLQNQKSAFSGQGFVFFVLSKAALAGLAGPPRALGALGGLSLIHI